MEFLPAIIVSHLQQLKSIFEDYPYIASAWLFGSQAKGKVWQMSDIDIAILVKDEAPAGRELFHEESYLSYRISKELGGKEVDLVNLKNQGLIFQHNVLRTGRVIYDSDRDYRIRFETRVICNYCDFEPTLRFMEKFYLQGRLRRLARL
ncbi:MAG TPA: nucleotidyltransferase domain-containing protein [Thermodesulfovibrionia bacterium]|nr:nucleotidyltransferase domain-containing protein [Thermodesulfovibrionia bacterium]